MRYRVVNSISNGKSKLENKIVSTDSSIELFNKCKGETVNLARVIQKKFCRKEIFCSFELYPTKDLTVYQRFFMETQSCNPLFYAITWHRDSTEDPSLYPALKCAEHFPPNTLLHCTVRGLKRSDLELILDRACELGIVNIFVLQGDNDLEQGDFTYASDLVTFIRQHYGQKFSICVAGYPEMHPKSLSKELDLYYLKAKVDAGADFIITQMFFESQLFIKFVKDCRNIGISVPIIAGIYPFTSAKLFRKMSDICQVKIPLWLQELIDEKENDLEAIKKLGIDLSVKIIKDIIDSGSSYAFHLFTMNKCFSAMEICRQLEVLKKIQ